MTTLIIKPALKHSELALQARDQSRGLFVVVYPKCVMTGAFGIRTVLDSFQAHYLTRKAAEVSYQKICAELMDCKTSQCRRYIGKPSLHHFDAFEVQDQLKGN